MTDTPKPGEDGLPELPEPAFSSDACTIADWAYTEKQMIAIRDAGIAYGRRLATTEQPGSSVAQGDDIMPAGDIPSQALAWRSIVELLDELDPLWSAGQATGVVCALTAIRRLASNAPQGEAVAWTTREQLRLLDRRMYKSARVWASRLKQTGDIPLYLRQRQATPPPAPAAEPVRVDEATRDLIGRLVSMAAIFDEDTAWHIAERIDAALAGKDGTHD